MKWLSSYMLHPPVTLTSLGFLQSRGLPLDSCSPPVLMFVKLSRAKTNSDLWLPAMKVSISTGTGAAKESLKWQFCLPAKTGQLVRKERCWQTAEVAVEFFWKLCYVAESNCNGNVIVRVGWQSASKEQGDRRHNLGYPWTQQWHGLSQLAVEIRDRQSQDPGAVPLLMSSRLLTLMPSPRAHMRIVEGKDWKMLQLFMVGGAGSLPGLISAFPLLVFPCSVQLKDRMSSSTNNLLCGLSGNCCCVQVTRCSCSKAQHQVQLSLQLQSSWACSVWQRKNRLQWHVWEAWIRVQCSLKASQALSTGYSAMLRHWISTANLSRMTVGLKMNL